MEDLWPCMACTFLNHALMKACEICETPRGKDGSASPFAVTTSVSTPSFITSSSPSVFASTCSQRSRASQDAGGLESSKRCAELDEIGQRLDICQRRDYQFLSLEALSLISLPSALSESLSQIPSASSSSVSPSAHESEADTTNATIPAPESNISSNPAPPAPAKTTFLDGTRLASQLTTLFLNDNNIALFPEELCRLSQLRELHMHYNKITTLPASIGNLQHLEKLFLSHNALTSLPPEIGRLSALQTLSLFNNNLTSVPPQLGQLRSLRSLFLNDNRLSSLPPQLFSGLSNLVVLQLNSNKLSSLPAQIGYLPRLKKLNIEGNALVTIPVSIGRLSDLSVLAFRRNLFSYAVSGTWNTGPASLLHLASTVVRRDLRSIASTHCSSISTTVPAIEAPSTDTAPTTSVAIDVDSIRQTNDGKDSLDEPIEDAIEMIQSLNITEELKKLLLEGENMCSVCSKVMYGDGLVVRVFPMERAPSFGGGLGLTTVLSSSTDANGNPTATASSMVATTGNATSPTLIPTTPPVLGGLTTGLPPNRPRVVVRGTYCSWLCAKRQVPSVNRPERVCTVPPASLPTPD